MQPDAAALAREFPPQTFALELMKTAGFVPPPRVGVLQDSVTLSLALGAHYFYTCVQKRDATFGLVHDFLSFSANRAGRHVFHGSSLGDDNEADASFSGLFSKFVGIAFMAEHAEQTWFASLRRIWDAGLQTPAGKVTFAKRDRTAHGPDYLSAPFDPEQSGLPDPLYVLEFKGRAGVIRLTHQTFADWRTQALNIVAQDAAGGSVKLKSWLLAFNYAFANGRGRECSALLVEDPWTDNDGRGLEPSRGSIETIVREHIARQCPKVGVGHLAQYVLGGTFPEAPVILPPLYRIRHPTLGDRRYVGAFANWGPYGELVWTPAPVLSLDVHDLDVDVFTRDGGGFASAHIRGRRRGGEPIRVEIHGNIPRTSPQLQTQDLERLVRAAFGGCGGGIFVGQDAGMIRECMRTPAGSALTGPHFTTALEIAGAAPGDAASDFVQLLRSGSVITDTLAVKAEPNAAEWWQQR